MIKKTTTTGISDIDTIQREDEMPAGATILIVLTTARGVDNKGGSNGLRK